MLKLKNKFYNTILFFLKKGEHPTLGKVKLAKLLFFADALAYHRLGHTITGKDYIKLPLGPVPVDYEEEMALMEENGLIRKRFRPTTRRQQESYIPCKRANLNVFTKKEAEIMMEVVKILRNEFTNDIVNLSHKLLPWDIIDIGELISFELFGLDNEEALKLKLKKVKLSSTEIVLNSPELMAAFQKGREDVRKRKVKKHKWV